MRQRSLSLLSFRRLPLLLLLLCCMSFGVRRLFASMANVSKAKGQHRRGMHPSFTGLSSG
jgi:hypothetical protein